MKHTWSFVLCLMVNLACTSIVAQGPSTRTLEVKMTFTGEGNVSNSNAIHIYLFDKPEIDSGAIPISWASATENGQNVSIGGLTATTVYLVAAYGDYDPTMGPPPRETPVSFYLPGDPYPKAIELDKEKTEIDFTFDDSIRMP